MGIGVKFTAVFNKKSQIPKNRTWLRRRVMKSNLITKSYHTDILYTNYPLNVLLIFIE
jgi:hypothetical protein